MKRIVLVTICCLPVMFALNASAQDHGGDITTPPSRETLGSHQGIPVTKNGITYELRQKKDLLLIFATGTGFDFETLGKGKVTLTDSKGKKKVYENLSFEGGMYRIPYGVEPFKGSVKLETTVKGIDQTVDWKMQ